VDSRALEGDDLSLTGIPLVHLSDVVYARALLAGEITRRQRRAVEGGSAEGDWVYDGHVCGNAGGKGQESNGFGEHVDCRKTVKKCVSCENR
jgi:hypothetical protein